MFFKQKQQLFPLLIGLFYFFLPAGEFFKYYAGLDRGPHIYLMISIILVGIVRAYPSMKLYGRIPQAVWWYLILLAFFFLSALWSPDATNTFQAVVRQLTYLAPTFIIFFTRRTEKNAADYAATYYIVSVLILAAISIGLLLSGEAGDRGRLSYSTDYNPTNFAAHISVSIILLLSHNTSFLPQKLVYKIIFLTILLLTLILTQGRNTIIALILSSFIVIAIHMIKAKYNCKITRKTTNQAFKGFIATVLGLFFLVSTYSWLLERGFISEKYYTRILSAVEVFESGDYDAATANRATNWQFYLNKPMKLLGYGFLSERGLVNAMNFRTTPHNAYITVLIHGGLFGLFLFMMFFVNLFYSSMSQKKYHKNGTTLLWLSLYLALLAIGNDVIHYMYFWGPIGLWVAIYDQNKAIYAKCANTEN